MVRITTGLFITLVGVTIGAVAAFSSTAFGEEDDGGRASYVTASRYFEAEEYEAALPHFKKAHQQSGQRPATIFGLAQCLRALKRYDEAIPLFHQYLETDPDNAAEVRETLGLLEDIAVQRKKEREAKAKREAEQLATREAEQRRTDEAEQRQRDAEREASAQEAEQRARAATEAALAAQPPPPPSVANPSQVVAPVAEEESGSIVSSPVFWIVTGAAVVGGAIAVGVLATREADVYGGSTDVVLSPLFGGRR